MNKQEAIKCIEQMGEYERFVDEPISKSSVLNIISQIHKPQKVVVPKHIADKIEYCKDTEGYGLFHAMDYCYNYKDSAEWLEYNQETFARAWLDGYTVEQEQLYTVEIPNPVLTDNSDSVTVLTKIDSGVVLTDVVNYIGRKQEPVYHLTEYEIKQNFEWAWQFAKEVE
ncbi:TPA: DUF1642 domain-containing protein [Streptococcus suis 11538]|uniref:DUF1642 domain-containing protein n=1 Tax=Streptococcus suis TaxID=1307 RepID=UPI000426B6AF|nr:DUF1642 domain-containing protein [Streptococcus suis]HEL2310503.1 DUF1642 domain-containing protein [Streptococcus suis]HEL2620145.1 DUF1642 domain-containing protein [Streptococcus suis]HEL2654316.1 DUF1642 domain-containing protein [Streptococcus suis]HEM2587612.1 DUF1642 domain-containing protein [Streptococcus suis]HEM2715318.1 DUF1642 domain-containing protein [Streptococcus suis]